MIYGTTASGGANNDSGAIFRLDINGGPATVAYSFPSNSFPAGPVILDGSTIYGMTFRGGTGGSDTIFKLDSTGSGYTSIHTFGGPDGRIPVGALTLVGSTLYGATNQGGTSNFGTIFSVDTDGSNYVAHSFSGPDGSFPVGSLTLGNSMLYGVTSSGVVFRIGLETTSEIEFLYSLSAGSPQGPLVVSGSTIYGMTASGGTGGSGTIFQLNIDGTGFTVLHNFLGGTDDGSLPSGALTLVGSTLYGTTQSGGTFDSGTVFSLNPSSGAADKEFSLLHSFEGGIGDGASPQGSLVYSNGVLYGTTSGGGPTFNGTVFSVVAPIPEPAEWGALLGVGMLALIMLRRRTSLARG
jgi:uncharacterized repeat protein (TIGR03803 family)